MTGKPTVSELGIDLAAQAWQRSGRGDGAIEVAFARSPAAAAPSAISAPAPSAISAPAPAPSSSPAPVPSSSPAPVPSSFPAPVPVPVPSSSPAEWVLLRVAGDPDQRVLIFDRHEWECFLDGARNGEFDEAAAAGPSPNPPE